VEAQHQQFTVLFRERAREEAAYIPMRSLSKLLDEAVREQGGVVQGFTGDGIMAVFGASVAFEDSPLRARHSALSILRWITAAGDELEVKNRLQPAATADRVSTSGRP
jgi:adenylate cyclase